MRGKINIKKTSEKIKLTRKFLKREYCLSLNKNLCNGCGLCALICPKEAIEEIPEVIIEGHLVSKPSIDFNKNNCNLCGECVIICPLKALSMKIDGDFISTIVKNESFPNLINEIILEPKKCNIECQLVCQNECPTDAIKISTTISKKSNTPEIDEVIIDKQKCIYCKRCEILCPFEALHVKKSFHGIVKLNDNLCPEDCVVCVDICPTHAIVRKNNKIKIDSEFCIFCSACQKICPQNALNVSRNWIDHDEIKSAPWLTTLKKLTSFKTLRKELSIKSTKKRKKAVQKRKKQKTLFKQTKLSPKAEEFLRILEEFKK